jgi:ParB family chromosome partitioning protein
LIVSRPGGETAATYQLIAGERRLLAAREAGLKRVPVVVKEASPQDLLELAIVENLQRQDLGPLEEAAAFRRLADEFGLTQDAVATRVGRSRPAITNSLRLLTLPDEIQASLARGEITAGHARAILGIPEASEQRRVWQRIVEAGLNVREAEALVKRQGKPRPSTPKRVSPDLRALEERLRGALGTKVELAKGRRGGRLTVYFYSDEELASIIDRFEA